MRSPVRQIEQGLSSFLAYVPSTAYLMLFQRSPTQNEENNMFNLP